jgi:hypothetical protein
MDQVAAFVFPMGSRDYVPRYQGLYLPVSDLLEAGAVTILPIPEASRFIACSAGVTSDCVRASGRKTVR